MKVVPLSTDQAPPISVPFRFFVMAPLFLILAGIVLFTGDEVLSTNRHHPALLAMTHLLTLGVLAMVMVGAVQQMLPVVIGNSVPKAKLVSMVILLPLLAGIASLVSAFLWTLPLGFKLAVPLLLFALFTFVVIALICLVRAAVRNATRIAMFCAVIGLFIAILFAAAIAWGYATGLNLAYEQLAQSHILLALGAWVLLLVMGVSYQIVPMFQLTAPYPIWITRYSVPVLVIVILFLLASIWFDFIAQFSILWFALFAIAVASFALVTLKLQYQRKRLVPDPTLSFFRVGMASLMTSLACFLLSYYFDSTRDQWQLWSVQLFIVGFALSLIQGMLYKIVPFLIWFHLFRGGAQAMQQGVPNMKQIIQEKWIWWHWWLHLFCLMLLLLAPFFVWAEKSLGIGLILQGLLLAINLANAIALYRSTLHKLNQLPITAEPLI